MPQNHTGTEPTHRDYTGEEQKLSLEEMEK